MIGNPAPESPGWYTHLWLLFRRLSRRQAAYRAVFGTPEGGVVLLDLAPFCCAQKPAVTERDIGRRDVWLRLMHMTQMHDEELAVLYAGLSPEQRHHLWRPGAAPTYMTEE